MDSKRIEELLERYWNADTTTEEEQELRSYFLGNTIPAHLKQTSDLFRYFESQRKKTLQDMSFDSTVAAGLNKNKNGKLRKLMYNTMRIAAGVAVVMLAVWFIRNEVRTPTPQAMVDTYDDPKLAFEETKKALLMISKGFGKAREETRKLNMFNEAQEEIRKKEKETKL